jgi:hypothetical protein
MVMRKLFCGLVGAALLPMSLLMAKDEPKTVPPGTPVTITVQPATPATPTVSLQLDDRHGHVTPVRVGFTHTGGGLIAVATPDADTIVVTMTGVAVAGAHPCKDSMAQLNFCLDQVLEVSWDSKDVKACKVTMDGQIIGALRSTCKDGGSAEESAGSFVLSGDGFETLALTVPSHSVGGDNLAVNCHGGPVSAGIKAGKYNLHGNWTISASHPRGFTGQASSADFDPAALDPLWISYWEPFHGIGKTSFGLQVTIKIADDTANLPPEKPADKPAEPVKAPEKAK